MQDEAAKPLIVLMHGDCKVSTKNLARAIPCKSVEPCKPDVAQRHSGYMVGGTSPFGVRKAMRANTSARSPSCDGCWEWSRISRISTGPPHTFRG